MDGIAENHLSTSQNNILLFYPVYR
jgi:hypothetical protein